jgi:hypothetical protein
LNLSGHFASQLIIMTLALFTIDVSEENFSREFLHFSQEAIMMNVHPKKQYGTGAEALQSRAVLDLPEVQPFATSQESTHPANLFMQSLLGPGNVRLGVMRSIIRSMKDWFPDVKPCPRAFVRVWAGCMYYLTKHSALLAQAKESGLLDEVLRPAHSGTGSSEADISNPSESEGPNEVQPLMPQVTLFATGQPRARLPAIAEMFPGDFPVMPLFA